LINLNNGSRFRAYAAPRAAQALAPREAAWGFADGFDATSHPRRRVSGGSKQMTENRGQKTEAKGSLHLVIFHLSSAI
jgi:hypothetical protein